MIVKIAACGYCTCCFESNLVDLEKKIEVKFGTEKRASDKVLELLVSSEAGLI